MYNWENKTIVVVEDVDFNFLLIKKQLKKTKASIVWLKNGQESIDYITDKKTADIILMDVRMPIVDGIEATKHIKTISPETPIIMQTACVIGNDFDDLMESGCNDYIFKPIIANDLLDKINNYILK
ncbi:MAG: response regulator [Bacteroidales bacterium]|nr:response regulator [Bacteroidales bacterium]